MLVLLTSRGLKNKIKIISLPCALSTCELQGTWHRTFHGDGAALSLGGDGGAGVGGRAE